MCYTIAACFPCEPLEKCMTFKDIFPGLSRSWNFQEKIQDFTGGVGTLVNIVSLLTYLLKLPQTDCASAFTGQLCKNCSHSQFYQQSCWTESACKIWLLFLIHVGGPRIFVETLGPARLGWGRG